MNTIRFYWTFVGAVLTFVAAVPLAAAAESSASVKPNIVIVMPDDAGYGDYGCLGSPIVKTPAADAFWRESVRFTQFHVSPTCAPTRSALMTGRHEFKNGVTHTILERERLTLQATTLAQMLKSAGYATGIFGKWHLGDEAEYQPGRRGFDEVYIHGGGGIGQTYSGSCGDAPNNTNINPALMHNGKFEKTDGYCTDLFFAQAVKWMDAERKAGRPFFTYLPLNAAHGPHVLPKEYYEHYLGKVPEETAKFYGMVENLDTRFGEMLAKLQQWGIADSTLVVFLTDNGGTSGTRTFNAGMRGTKGTPYQGGTRVPSFWRWPAAFQGGVDCNALSAHIDIFPTLAEVAGVKLSDDLKRQVEGRSLLPLLANPQAEWPERTLVTHVGRWAPGKVAEAKYSNCSIQDSRYSLVNNRELYDLKEDPGESKNVIDQHPDVVAKLRKAYDQWWEEVQPLLVNEDAKGPRINPFKELYWQQFGGGPDEALLKVMDPAGKFDGRYYQRRRRKPARAGNKGAG